MKTKKELKQLDILNVLRGTSDKFIEDEKEIEVTKKSISPFDFINDIRKNKKGNLLDNEDDLRFWNSYLLLQGLSYKDSDVLICNFMNKYTGSMTKRQMYQALLLLIPQDKYGFHKWIKKESEDEIENIDFVSKYFECAEKEAKEFIEIMGSDWANQIKTKFGGVLQTQTRK